jgi:CRP-like cAMP-binding protein
MGFENAVSLEARQKPPENNLLRALRRDDFELLRSHLTLIEQPAGRVLYEPGDVVNHAYFPCGRSIVSYRVMLPDGRGVEAALIGREGAIGGIVSHGKLPAYARALVQHDGPFLKISSARLENLKRQSPSLNHLFARYADCLVAQLFQGTACNAAHSVEQRAAKWMLATLERIGADEVPLTQEQLGGLLGIGRSYVSRVLRRMREEGLLASRRGRIVVKRPEALQACACGCNTSVRDHFDEVLRGVYPTQAEES